MKPVDRQKMCTTCDGRVPFESIICPYCSSDLSKAVEVDAQISRNQAIQDSLTSLYTPPYKGKSQEIPKTVAPKEPRFVLPAHHGAPTSASTVASGQKEATDNKANKAVLISILTLSIGSMLFILGLLQIFFSTDGVLRLEWKTDHWFIYALASLPLLYYGYRKAEEK